MVGMLEGCLLRKSFGGSMQFPRVARGRIGEEYWRWEVGNRKGPVESRGRTAG